MIFIRKRNFRQLVVHCAIGASLYLAVTETSKADADSDLKISDLRGGSAKKPVSVLQNRFFLKARRPEIGLVAGGMLNEAYTDTKSYGLRAGLFFNEWLGVEFQYLKTNVADSADRRALNQMKYWKIPAQNDATARNEVVTIDPEVNAVNGFTDGSVILAPFYGKLNLLNKLIVYSDLYLSAGVSQVKTDQGDKAALTYGAGQRFYLYDSWSIRLDVRARNFSEQRSGQETRRNSVTYDLGASYFFF